MRLYRQVGIASVIMMTSVFLSRLVGLLREMVIAYAGGAEGAVDAYQVAFIIPEILNHVLASGFLSVTFIPIFSAYLTQDRESAGWRVFSTVLTVFGGAMVVMVVVSMLFARPLIAVLAPGMTDPVLTARAVHMTRIILPAQFFFFSGGLFMAVQFAKGRFAIPALAPLVYNTGIIVGGILLGGRLGMAGFSWGALIGAFVGNFLLQAWGAARAGMRYRFSLNWRLPDLRKYVLLSLPLMFGLTITFSTEIFLKFFGSFLPEGGIAALTYDLRLTFVLVGFFGQAVGTASFPFLAQLAARGRMEEMNDLLNTTLRYLAFVMPFSVLVMVLRQEVVMLLFQRGRFDAAAAALTSSILPYLMIGTVGFATQTVVVRGYYAMQDTLFPALFSTVAVVLSLPLYAYASHRMGAQGVALAVSFSALLQVGILYEVWHRRCRNPERLAVYRHYLKMAVMATAIGVGLEMARRWWTGGGPPQNHLSGLLTCILIGVLFSALLLLLSRLFRMPELNQMIHRLLNRLGGRLAGPRPTA